MELTLDREIAEKLWQRGYRWGVTAQYEFAGFERRTLLSKHRTHEAAARHSGRIERKHGAIGYTTLVDLGYVD